MSAYGVALRCACLLLALTALIGLIWRARVRTSLGFALYLVSAVVGRGLLLVAPERFWNWEFMLWSDGIQVALRGAIAFEISYKVFRPLPVGLTRIRVALALVLLGTLATLLWLPPRIESVFDGTVVLQRVSYGIALLFAAFLLITWYYAIPLDVLHLEIAAGFTFLNLTLAFTEALTRFDPTSAWGADLVVKSAYPVLLAGWCISAWRPEPQTWLSPATQRWLQPWRAS